MNSTVHALPMGSFCGAPCDLAAAGIDTTQGRLFAGGAVAAGDAYDGGMGITDVTFSTRLGPLIWTHLL